MSVDIEIWVGDEPFPFCFNGADTQIILSGIAEWKGIATDRFLKNFRVWEDHYQKVYGPNKRLTESAEALYRLAEVNRTYVSWSKS